MVLCVGRKGSVPIDKHWCKQKHDRVKYNFMTFGLGSFSTSSPKLNHLYHKTYIYDIQECQLSSIRNLAKFTNIRNIWHSRIIL